MHRVNISSFLLLVVMLIATASFAQNESGVRGQEVQLNTTASQKWYDRMSISGYMQLRYNRLLETNKDLGCEQCDKSWGDGGGFFLRRIRLKFAGQIGERVYYYFQPDFASFASSTSLNYGQIRDAYVDVGIDRKNQFRFRIGQSKIPYGFENMQSSQNRLPLDRNDGLNSALRNERDAGVMFYWAPTKIRERFKMLVRSGLKGSGDYGVFGFGVYNGQTASKPELNKNKHYVARLSYPFAIGNQIIEPGVQAYTGKYVIPTGNLTKGVKYLADRNYTDERVAATFVLYPQPFGIQAEYNVGRGPEFNKVTDSIEVKSLTGGYVTLNYKFEFKNMVFYPFTRLQFYEGGKKHELDARSYKVNELEIGLEWLPVKEFELVAMYTISSRQYEDFANQNNFQTGSLLRLQAQVNIR